MSDATPCCGNCRYWIWVDEHPWYGDQKSGVCRRYPPPANTADDIDTQPHTGSLDWCGEHRPVKGHDGKRVPKPDNLPSSHDSGPRKAP